MNYILEQRNIQQMNSFLKAFFSIDRDMKEYITMQDLEHYMEKNNFDPIFTEVILVSYYNNYSLEKLKKKLK